MTSALVSFTFNNTNINTVTVNGKHWTRAKEICQSLKYQEKHGHVIEIIVACENIRHKYVMKFDSTNELYKLA